METVGQPVRILIVDDHKLFAEAIRSTLERQQMTIIGVAHTAHEALDILSSQQPDLALVDIGLPDLNGIEAGRQILSEWPEIKVLAVTALVDPDAVGEALRAGFSGYLSKDTPLAEFVTSVEATLGGHVVIPQRAARGAAGGRTREQKDAALLADQLTGREREVLALLASGSPSEHIAESLSISPNTVRSHIQNILTKLQVHSRLEAVAFAVRHGIVSVTAKNGRGAY